ncbi:MAG: IPT/TIG domain-containing protein [Trueperaceae bacterium]
MLRRFLPFLLASVVLGALAACGEVTTPTPDPTPDLTLTGVSPTVALPGANVVLEGTGFEAGQAVTFDGIAATVTAITDTTMTVTVPATYGYPTIAVEDVSEEKLLFVGTAYAGEQNLDAVQAALDALPENAALRLPAGTYAAPGTSLDLDNRKLFGAGPTTIIDVPDGLDLYARSTHLTVLQDLSVIGGGDVYVNRGRVSTAALSPVDTYGGVLFQDVDLTIGTFELDDDYLRVRISGATIDAAYVGAYGYSSMIDIEDSTFDVNGAFYVDTYGGLAVRDTTITTVDEIYVYIDYVLGITFERTTLDAGTYFEVYSYGPVVVTELAFRDSAVTAASYLYVGSSGAPMVVENTTFVADDYIDIDSDDYGASITLTGASLTAGTSVDLGGSYAGMTVTGSTVTAYTYLDVDGYGPLVFVDSTLSSATDWIYIYTDYSDAMLFLDSSATAATYVEFYGYGPITVAGGSLEAGTYIQLFSRYAGEITVRDTTEITAGTFFRCYDDNNSYAGNNGIFTFEGNAATTVGGMFELNSWYSDVVVRENGPIEAVGEVFLHGPYSHVTVADNDRIESDADITLYAAGSGGRLAATNNVFVANAGAGTITLETQPGELTRSGNTFTGTLATPGN